MYVEIVSREVVFAGAPVRLVIATDVTARMKTERKLREALDAERAATIRLRALDEMKTSFARRDPGTAFPRGARFARAAGRGGGPGTSLAAEAARRSTC